MNYDNYIHLYNHPYRQDREYFYHFQIPQCTISNCSPPSPAPRRLCSAFGHNGFVLAFLDLLTDKIRQNVLCLILGFLLSAYCFWDVSRFWCGSVECSLLLLSIIFNHNAKLYFVIHSSFDEHLHCLQVFYLLWIKLSY